MGVLDEALQFEREEDRELPQDTALFEELNKLVASTGSSKPLFFELGRALAENGITEIDGYVEDIKKGFEYHATLLVEEDEELEKIAQAMKKSQEYKEENGL